MRKILSLLFLCFLFGTVNAAINVTSGSTAWTYTTSYPPTPSPTNGYPGALRTHGLYSANSDGSYPWPTTSPIVALYKNNGGATAITGAASGSINYAAHLNGIWFLSIFHNYDSGNNVYNRVVESAVFYPIVEQSQTITLSPDGGAASLVSGQTFNGFASGAQGGNPYNISIVSGQGSASINSSTGAFTVTANGAGLITYKVWASAGNGYARSPDAQSSIAVAASKKVTVTIPANNSDYPILYTLRQDGIVIGTYTQPPGGTAYILQIDVGANDGPVTMTATASGLKQDGNSIIVGDPLEEVVYVISDEILPDVPTTVTPPPINDLKKPDANPPGAVWTPGNASNDPAQQKDLLTNQVFREGIDKLLAQGKNSQDDTGVTDPSGVDLSSAPSPSVNVTVEGVNSLKDKLPESPQFSSVGTTDTVSVSFPMITGLTTTQNFSFTWNFSSWISQLSWLRTFILGCLSVWFFFAINKQLRNSVAN